MSSHFSSFPEDFFMLSSALMCVLDREGTIIHINPAWERNLNVVASDLEHSHYLTWVHPDDQAISLENLAYLAQGKQVTFANRWRDCASHYHWLNWEISPVLCRDKFYAVASDITAQKRAERILRDSEERFELAIQGSNHGLWDWNLETNEIYLSPRWKNILGYQDNEIANQLDEWCRFIHPDDFSQTWGTLEAYLDRKTSQYESTYRMCHKDGSYRWVLARAAALWNADGQPCRMVGTYIDITERKRTEQALESSEGLLSAIFDVTKIGLCVTNEAGRFVRVNPAYCELFGYTAQELIGQHFTTVLSPDSHVRALALHQALLNNDPYVESEGEWCIAGRDGKRLYVNFTMGLLVQKNGQRFRVTTITDVTKRKLDQEERNRLFNFSLDMQSIIGFDMSFRELNSAWEKTLGWTIAELLTKSPIDLVHPDDKQISIKTVKRLMTGQTAVGFENRYFCKNGTYKWLSWNVYPLVDQQTLYAVTRDITETKQAEEEIKRQQAFIRLVVDSVPNLIFIKDHYGNFIFANQAVANLMGTSVEKLINRAKIEPGHSLECVKTNYSPSEIQVIKKRKAIFTEESCHDAQGDSHYFQMVKKPFEQSDGDILVLSVGTDITNRKQQEEALKRSEARYKDTVAELETILDNSIIGIAYVQHRKFKRVNSKLEFLLGYAPDELCELPFNVIFPSQENYQQLEQEAYPLLAEGKTYDSSYQVLTKAHTQFWSRLVGKAVDVNELDKGVIWIIEDITVQRQAELNLRLTATVFETTADGILITDAEKRIQRVNPAFTRITGYTAEEVYNKKTSWLSSGRHDEKFYQNMWKSIIKTGHWQGEIWNRKKNGEIYVAWSSISAITNENGIPVQYMAVLSDISRLQEDIENVRYLANYDSLTRLPNRLLFLDNLQKTYHYAQRHKLTFALLFIDLDEFKPVNDTLGHAVGDQLLQQVAERLQNCVGENDTIARLGGDEFTIILKDIETLQEAGQLAANVIQVLQKPFQLQGKFHAVISASIGITVYPFDNSDVDNLLKHADIAMYAAKAKGRGCFCFYQGTEVSCEKMR